jgi:hypothetical protein
MCICWHCSKRLLTKEQMSMQKVRIKKCFLHLTCETNYHGVVLILCMLFNLCFTFFCFINHKLYNFFVISYNYVNNMWKLYAQRAREKKMCFKHRTRMKVDHTIKDIKIVYNFVLIHKLWFLWNIFCHEFPMFGHAHFFPPSLEVAFT